MKKMLISIVTIIIVIGIIVGIVFYFTSKAATSADNFFTLIKSGDIDGAYQSSSQQFKEKTTQEQFESFVKTYSIIDIDTVFWNSRSINPSTAGLEGSIKTKDDKTIPIKVDLVKESGQYKILSVNVKGGIPNEKVIPSDPDLVKLVNSSIHLFGQSVRDGDFSILYSSISKLWQDQVTPNQLQDIFKSFVDQKINITISNDTIPVFSEKPIINEDGVLILKGYYSEKDHSPINFQLKYIYEYPNWKLFGIKINL